MSVFDKLKNKAKDASDKIDWDELTKKKDAAIEGAKQIKDDYDARQRQKKEDSLYKKEKELNELEKELERRNKSIKQEDWLCKKESELEKLEDKLKSREKTIRQKEIKLSQKFFLRFVLFAGGFSLIGIFFLDSITPLVGTNKQKETVYVDKNNSSTRGISSSPYTSRERAVYDSYNDLNTTDPNFDVGGYCLEKEKSGDISFEECLVVAAAKLISK